MIKTIKFDGFTVKLALGDGATLVAANAYTDDKIANLPPYVETDPIYTADKPFIALKSEIPTELSELSDDSTHRTVTDAEKSVWDAKQPAGNYATGGGTATGTNTGDQDLSGLQPLSEKGANNGYASLDSGGKVPTSQLPSTLLVYKGVWNASTNTPVLLATDTDKKGFVYNVGTAGTQFGIDFKLGDWAIYNDAGVIEKSDNSDDVTSVNGQQGAVVLDAGDVGAYTKSETDDLVDGKSDIGHDHTGETIKPDVVQYDLTPTIPTTQGSQYWDETYKVLSTVLGDGVILQNGLEMYVRIVNKTGAQINDGQVVYINGAQGNRPTAALAKADAAITANVIGVATQNIANNQEGFITVFGNVSGFNTSGYSDGANMYLSATVAGALTPTEPTYPNHKVIVAIALNSTNNGQIFVRPNHILELAELHGVDLTETTPLTTDSVLIQETSTGKVKKSLFSTLVTFLSSTFAKLTGNTNISSDKFTDNNGNVPFKSIKGGVEYHPTKWFTTTQSVTISSDGLSVTAAGAQFTAGSSQVSAMIEVNGVQRIITTPNPTTTVVYVTEEFPSAMRGQTYTSGQWGVYNIKIGWDGTYIRIYNTNSSNGLYIDGSNIIANRLSGIGGTFDIDSSKFRFYNTTGVFSINGDTTLSRNAAGIFEINNGTSGTFRDLILKNINKTGYDYFAVSATADTINDTRSSNKSGVVVYEVDTVASATKGGGTWRGTVAYSPLGGIMVKLTNKTGANSVKGTVVYASTTTDNAFGVNPIDGDMPFGVVYDNGIADGAECWVVISGIAEVLMTDSAAATRSYIAYSSATTAGRISVSASAPAATTHFREIGHTLESKTAGTNVLVKCILHFN